MQAAPLAYEFGDCHRHYPMGSDHHAERGQRRVGVGRVGPSVGVGSQVERTVNAEVRGQAGLPLPCSPPRRGPGLFYLTSRPHFSRL